MRHVVPIEGGAGQRGEIIPSALRVHCCLHLLCPSPFLTCICLCHVYAVWQNDALVHYMGWNVRYREWIPLASGRMRLSAPQTRSPRNHASSAEADAAARRAASAAAASSSHDALNASCEANGGSESVAGGAVGKRRAREGGALPEGWATAVAAETLREFSEVRLHAADWFVAFAAHVVSKRSGLNGEKLLAHFVVALSDLQMLGLCQASKRPRGTVEKRVFG